MQWCRDQILYDGFRNGFITLCIRPLSDGDAKERERVTSLQYRDFIRMILPPKLRGNNVETVFAYCCRVSPRL